ncbi:MAG: NHLP bacteriocin export ABC transporter permease/ATPase subunit [Rivularia sp. (in: Bacteria)]|nr:NHLP bacteriocin export ABC transporter permease/ATPase subunit [Rivularia sp. MS3]
MPNTPFGLRHLLQRGEPPQRSGLPCSIPKKLLLDNSEQVWLIKSGCWAVFAINIVNGVSKGRKRYLFSVKAGEVMFGASSISSEDSYQIMAVALEESEVIQLSSTDEVNIEQIESWVNHLSSTVSEIISPVLPTPAKIPGCTILDSNEVFQPSHGNVVWAKVLQGKANLLGFNDLEITSNIEIIPLQTYTWLQAKDVVEIGALLYSNIDKKYNFIKGLNLLQSYIVRVIYFLELEETQAELIRNKAREELNNRAISESLNNFANIFTPESKNLGRANILSKEVDKEQALLSAAGAVGRALGITIHPPTNSEDLRRVRNPIDVIARASNIRIRRITLRDGWWYQDSGPLLAYTLKDNLSVAVLPVDDNRYEIIDCYGKQRIKCDKKAAATLSPNAYTFYRPLPIEIPNFLPILQFALKGRSKEIITILGAGIAIALLGMIVPQATAILIDRAIPDADKSLLFQIALGLVATTLGASLFQITQAVAILRLESFADTSTQAAVWDRLLKLKASFFRQYSVGDLSQRVAVITQIRQKIGNTILKSLFSSLFSLLNLGLLFYYSLPLALVATFVALIYALVTIVSGILTLRKIRPLINMQGKLFGMLVQIINGVGKFRIAGAESRAFAYWAKQYRHQLSLMMSAQNIEDNLVVINSLLSAITPAILFAMTISLIQQSQTNGSSFSTGTFLAFNAAFGTFISGTTSLSSTIVDILEALPLWERAQPIFQATPDININKSDPGRLSGRIEVKNVTFSYSNGGFPVLENVSLKAEPGEFIALVGASGSGKSTLLRLLLGFDTPQLGSINYDGQELAALNIDAVRRQLGVVLQNSQLMSASIFENISSNANLTMEEAWNAAQMAGLASDISTMPMGMHTIVSEGGSNLSGGQRQRLIIARALAKRPRILLFDEATSALDNRTQAIVSESLDKLNVTRIVVAHRLSTIRNANRIYVLQKGRIIQQGNFEQLAQLPVFYLEN